MKKIKNFIYDYGLIIGAVVFFLLLGFMSGITGEMYHV